MPSLTPNYNLKKPLGTESALVSVLNENTDKLDEILYPAIDDTEAPTSSSTSGLLSKIVGWFANRIKAITGNSHWYDTPPTTLSAAASHMSGGGTSRHPNATISLSGFMSTLDKAKLDNATSEAYASRLIMRDSSGRAKIATPSNSQDIVNKSYVDNNCVRKSYAATMSAILTAYSNTSYTTKQVRNIVFWTSGDTPPTTSYGDIVIKTF